MSPKLVICASGEGTGFEALVMAARHGQLQAQVVGLIASRPGIGALDRAARLGIPSAVVSPKAHASSDLWDLALREQLRAWNAEWVVLAGFLTRIGPAVLRTYPNRIVNTHPALLPKHGGVGMYGKHVHRAVLASGDKESGVTVHLVDEEFDHGRVLGQARFSLEPGETAASLESKVKALEAMFYARVLNDLVTGRINTG